MRMVRRVLARDHWWLIYLGVGLSATAASYAFADEDTRNWLEALFGVVGGSLAAFGAWRNRAPHLGSWLGLGFGVALLGLGDLAWAILSPDGSTIPVPSAADAIYLAGYAAAIMALTSLTWPRGTNTWESIFDTFIASLGVALLAWVFLIQPASEQTAGLDSAGTFVTMVYPSLDVVLAILLLGSFFGTHRPFSTQLLYVALAMFLFSDLSYLRTTFDGTYVGGGIADVGYFVGYTVWGVAGLHPSARLVGRPGALRGAPLSWLRVLGLVASCLLAPLMLLYEWGTGRVADIPLIAGASVVLIMLWAGRLAITVNRLRVALSEQAKLEGKLREQAEKDVLVGLLNRASFMNRVRAALDAGDALAVLFIDLDDFKVINDTCGHPGGDAVLIEVAHRVTSLLRPPDVAARLGGDEFGILLPGGDTAAAKAVASRVLLNLARPVIVEGRAVHIEASIGISTGSPGKGAEDLIRESDVAMYLAKSHGKNQFLVFEAAVHQSVIKRMGLRAELEEAIALKQFTVVYQPIVRMPDGSVADCEALVRWQHPVRGLLAPGEFIDIAEETGLIVSLGRWLMLEACNEAAEWVRRLGENAPGVAINVSALQVRHPNFASDVRRALEHSGLEPHRLAIELTESILIEVGSATTIVSELNDIGVRIAIDDFGTGYSSLAYLAAYPVDVLKIDRSFVAALEAGPRDARLVSAIIALGTDLGLAVIAEGVETEAQLKALLGHGCLLFQGYYFSRPMLGHDLMPLLAGAVARHEPFTKNLLVPVERSA